MRRLAIALAAVGSVAVTSCADQPEAWHGYPLAYCYRTLADVECHPTPRREFAAAATVYTPPAPVVLYVPPSPVIIQAPTPLPCATVDTAGRCIVPAR